MCGRCCFEGEVSAIPGLLVAVGDDAPRIELKKGRPGVEAGRCSGEAMDVAGFEADGEQVQSADHSSVHLAAK